MAESPDPGSAPRVRRRVSPAESPEAKGRSGCLITGAVLGIIVGATFAFYGLPPILRHFYGEQHVAAGQVFEGDAKTVSVSYVGFDPDPASSEVVAVQRVPGWFYLTLDVTTNKTWRPKVSDFSVQFSGVGDWVEADRAHAVGSGGGLDPVDGQLDFPLGERVALFLRFPRPIEAGATPRYLHIAAPLLRFELPPPK